ncbi:MAG: nucleotide-diphospho-sugar transferase [Paludibacteraceae bacterium]|nr:nucleotide-diphospho-sugar transferase [Paludibacteraceae bacterium]
MYQTPILLLLFNRLETTKQLFISLKEIKPKHLYIFADGPRYSIIEDKTKCEEVRNWVVSNITWDCELKTLFQEKNLGCGKGPATGITWFFSQVEEGLILEDDTIPNVDFYEFAAILLEKYRDCNDIMAINSLNFQEKKRGDGSYYFSMQNGSLCAWATWRRAWLLFDYNLDIYSESLVRKSIKWYGVKKREYKWWLNIYIDFKANAYNDSAWDYQFIFSIWVAKAKSIIPNVNLATNIGFGSDATHTRDFDSVLANKPTSSILPIVHPSSSKICREADLYYHDFYYNKFVEQISLFKKIKRKIKSAFRKSF